MISYRLMSHVIGFCCVAGMTVLGSFTFFAMEYYNMAVRLYEPNALIRGIEVICGFIALIYLFIIVKHMPVKTPGGI